MPSVCKIIKVYNAWVFQIFFDVVGCRYVGVKSYERYRNLVLKSREYKDARIEAAEKRAKKEKEEKDAEKDDEENAGSPRDSLDKTWKKER